MSVKAMQWVWEHSRSGGNLRLVLLAIADSADHDGDNAWPSVATIAAKCSLSERTVQRAIQVLEEMGELVVARQAGGSSATRADRRPNRYRLPLVPARDSDGVTERHPEDDGVTTETPRGDNQARRGDNGAARGDSERGHGVTLLSPEPSLIHPSTVLEPSGILAADLAAARSRPPSDFDTFWSLFPRKESMGAARRAWRDALRKADAETLIDGARRYAAAAAGNDPQFVVTPARWLENERWKDVIQAKQKVSRSTASLAEWAKENA